MPSEKTLDGLFDVVPLEILVLQEGFVAVQIVPEQGVIILISFPDGIGNLCVPVFHKPAVTVVIMIGTHILLEATITVAFGGIHLLGRYHVVISGILFQNVVIAQKIRAAKIHRIQMETGINRGNI